MIEELNPVCHYWDTSFWYMLVHLTYIKHVTYIQTFLSIIKNWKLTRAGTCMRQFCQFNKNVEFLWQMYTRREHFYNSLCCHNRPYFASRWALIVIVWGTVNGLNHVLARVTKGSLPIKIQYHLLLHEKTLSGHF